ncbi:DUF535 family protein [Helicobacter kayseriensis]|uniref:DUF535 family protein n=1 Tax=Helicobacter kayseriensis TaxID=2905877 RepID=UPI001E605FDE|nr:DUF535 family protein [Helicobacter kayseriensis]MCE3046900.1 DUF535 family protein [Helicobacter kayseriensis]MCE3048440.1 DUF535 family protein [Helicobacter kayseriensis]
MRYRWPKFSELFGDFGQRHNFDSKVYYLRQVTRYLLRCMLAKKQIKQFVMLVNQHDRLVDFFHQNKGGDYRIVCSQFVNQKFKPNERLEYIQKNFPLIFSLRDESFKIMLCHKEIVLFSKEGFDLVFKVNGTFEEGFFAFELKLDQQRIYAVSFCLFEEKLIIASLQGLIQGDEAKEKIKVLTKKCFGLRPQVLLIEVMRFALKSLKCKTLLGIAQTSQVRFSKFGKRGYFVDYDALWEEVGGVRCGDYFDITTEKRKELCEIPSNKRSMYKKRFAFLDEVQETILKKMHEIGF